MILEFKVNTDDIFADEERQGPSLEDLIKSGLKREILEAAKAEIKTDKFNEFSDAVKNEIVAGVKTKMVSFLSEEIALTDKWGKKTWVGSIEDLLKQRFDDVLLRPVDSEGKTVTGCVTRPITWIEWKIEKELVDTVKRQVETAKMSIEKKMAETIKATFTKIMNEDLRAKVGEAFQDILAKR